MNRPTFQEKTEVKIVSHDRVAFYRINGEDREYDMYGWRGKVTEIIGFDDNKTRLLSLILLKIILQSGG